MLDTSSAPAALTGLVNSNSLVKLVNQTRFQMLQMAFSQTRRYRSSRFA